MILIDVNKPQIGISLRSIKGPPVYKMRPWYYYYVDRPSE